jgi:hypothetical protein
MTQTADIDIGGGKKIPFRYPSTGNMHGIVSNMFADRAYPRIDFIADLVETVLDVGANIGPASIYFSLCYPCSRVFSY